jgi:TRAP-type uncharacterized transport system substrate-binding protein
MKRLVMALMMAGIIVGGNVWAAEPAPICDDSQLIMGTGDEKGTFAAMYRNIASACQGACEYRNEEGKPSSGGFENVNLLTKRLVDIAMVPEDVLELSKRTDQLVGKKVRVLGALHTNTLHILVPKSGLALQGSGFKIGGFDTGFNKKTELVYIRDLSDLKNRKVAVFASALVTLTLANERLGYNMELIEVGDWREGLAMIEKGEVFAFATTGGWPIPWVDKADQNKFTLANVSDQDIKRLGAPFYQVSLNYQRLGAFGVNSFGSRNLIATWDYSSPSRVKQLLEYKECINSSLPDIKEMRGSHPSWVDVEDFSSAASVSWPKYEPKTN